MLLIPYLCTLLQMYACQGFKILGFSRVNIIYSISCIGLFLMIENLKQASPYHSKIVKVGDTMILVVFGAPGVGKGTQAELLSQRKGIPHLSTGAALRQAITEGTELGKTAKSYVEAGRLVPDEIVTGIVRETLAGAEYTQGCILDGFPRTRSQAEALDEILRETNREIDCVINVDVDGDEIVQRMLKRGRQDDTEEIIRERLAIYNASTMPLLEYYKERGKLCTIDGNAEIEEVYERISSVMQNSL